MVSAKNENTNTYKRTEPAQNLFVLPVPVESLLLTSSYGSFYLWIILPSAASCRSLANMQGDGDVMPDVLDAQSGLVSDPVSLIPDFQGDLAFLEALALAFEFVRFA